MKKVISFCLIALCLSMALFAETISIKNPGFFEDPLRDGQPLFPDSLTFDSEAEELTFPDLGTFIRLGDYNFPNLKKVIVNNVDYMPGGAFFALPNLEEIEINGRIGHFDCTMVSYCPNLRKVVFNGAVSSTGGPGFKYDCPQLDSVVFNGLVVDFGLGDFPGEKTPKFKNYIINGAILKAYNDSLTPPTNINKIKSNPTLIEQAKTLAKWQSEVLTASGNNPARYSAYQAARVLLPVLDSIGLKESHDSLKAAMNYAWNLGDVVKTNIDILKESPAYSKDTMQLNFTYVLPSDSLLTDTRLHFNLDSIAGNGNDISRIKNLLYWVHNNIKHDGSNGVPEGEQNLKNIYYSAKRDSCGYNCRALAIALTEALLAEGIPARYLTCESKLWDTDEDCHVICVAWSESLNKWIWVDPTFAAYVTDENGLMLHPGEVRYRLQHDLPLILNSDANWNNLSATTKEYYLYSYMAKNLYIMSSNTLNQAEPEGKSKHLQGRVAALVPEGSNYTNAVYFTSDPEVFWQPPNNFIKESVPE